MSIPFEGFCGPSYQTANKFASIERLVNWYVEPNESGEEKKYKLQLIPSPGNAPFSLNHTNAPFNQPARGHVEYRGGVYGVNGTCCYGLNSDGTMTNLGTVVSDGKPVSFAPNAANQIFFCSAGVGYYIAVGFDPAHSVLFPIVVSQRSAPAIDFFGASYATFQDGYILVITPDSSQFQISGDDNFPINKAEVWSAANISIQFGQSDRLRAIISSREYVRLLGARRCQVFQNVGPAGQGGFPFQSYNETFIETGISAPFSLCDLGGPLFWIGQDSRGVRAAWLDSAFNPQRISNFAVEQFWQGYSTVEDAIAFPFLWNGHLMVQVSFPTADRTWVYDYTVSQLLGRAMWHERTYTDFIGRTRARSEQFHCFAYGKHLVGSVGLDGNPGAIYQYTGDVQQVENPMVLLNWSNDGGNTYGFEKQLPIGKAGEFYRRVYWNRGGYSRERVYSLAASELADYGALNAGGTLGLTAMVRQRIAPHLYQQNKRVIYSRIEFELSRGIGASGPGAVGSGLGIVGADLDLTVCDS